MLPEFKGKLGPAPWSGIRLTSDLIGHLKLAAHSSCKGCGGSGHRGEGAIGEMVQICHCLNRFVAPQGTAPRALNKIEGQDLFP